jgi:hypothetical protein
MKYICTVIWRDDHVTHHIVEAESIHQAHALTQERYPDALIRDIHETK